MITLSNPQNKTIAQDLGGSWVGYMLDLGQLKEDKLPKVYSVKMILSPNNQGNYKGVISKYWDRHYNTISSVIGKYDKQSKMISFCEDEFYKISTPNASFHGCKIFTSLYAKVEKKKIVLEGRYYGIRHQLGNETCPVGKLHFKRPNKDSLSFAYLQEYLKSKKRGQLAKVGKVPTTLPNEPKPVNKNDNVSSVGKNPSPFNFPIIIVSTSPMSSLQTPLHYDVFKLIKSQSTIMGTHLTIKEQTFSIIVNDENQKGDTISIIFDGINLSTNHKLSPSSSLNIDMDFNNLVKANMYTHKHVLTLVPFSWTDKSIELNLEVFDKGGEKVNSQKYSFRSSENLDIPIDVDLRHLQPEPNKK